MKLLLYISLAIAVVCVFLVAATKLWLSLVNALVFLVILFLIVAIIALLFRRNKQQS
jgi:membrane protein YdbS with pleckstrin-like domain